ncbi:hypothetical protein HaLaN_11386 [Haematococcus lacustris]|uniref:Uncharacterized protein n=1 Tax=Haematococcus lacustris TaxID=44745 RepID=A0A699YZP9_HAELA|nr:hypothetical protein HaLaN_11386 [Haematococcus lacustris]
MANQGSSSTQSSDNTSHIRSAGREEHPIPLSGNWDEVSGEVFLRTMMSKPEETARVGHVSDV